MKERRILTGVVFSDLGQAASFMSLEWVQKVLHDSLGFFPYPATLNVRVESEKEIATWQEIKREIRGVPIDPPDASFCRARCYLVEIEGTQRGAVLLPEVGGYPEDKIEVIAPVRLKDQLHVRDGERITLEFTV